MKLHPAVWKSQYRTLLQPSPGPRLGCDDTLWTAQRAIDDPAFVARCLPPPRQGEIFFEPP
jgi:hypothetical protein